MINDLKSKIEAWKSEYGKLYKTIVEGDEYIWRKLKRKEYVEVMNILQQEGEDEDSVVYKRQAAIVQKTCLYPEKIDDELEKSAGLAITLSDEIIAKSGFGQAETQEL